MDIDLAFPPSSMDVVADARPVRPEDTLDVARAVPLPL